MATLDTDNSICLPSLKLLGDYWSLRIIDVLSDGELRFCEIERKIEGVNTATLSSRLKKLELGGQISRNEHTRADVSYELTKLGIKVLPVLQAINEYSKAAKSVPGSSD